VKSLIVHVVLLLALNPTAYAGTTRDTSTRYSTPVGKWGYQYIPLREALHGKIIEMRLRAGATSDSPRLIFTAGGFGAGKSFVTGALEKLNILDVSQFLWIDPDSIKEDIPEYAELKNSDPESAATLVHKESGHIQEQLLELALKKKKNIIVDGSLRAKDWWTSEFKRIRGAYPEYSISIINVSAPDEILLERVASRGKVTGRLIPSALVLETAAAVRESVNYLSGFADLTVEIENGISPTLKSVKYKGRSVSAHFDMSGALGQAVPSQEQVTSVSASELKTRAERAQRIVVLAGYGDLGYEDFSLLKSYVDRVAATFGADTLFVLSQERGVGRARQWLQERLKNGGGAVLVGDQSGITSMIDVPENKNKLEVVALRGESRETDIIKAALVMKIPVVLVRDPGLEPETEAVALRFIRNPHFDADPTKIFEVSAHQQDSLRVVRSLEIPKIQRVFEQRTRTVRNLYRRIETVSDQELVSTVLEAYPELILLTEGIIATPEAQKDGAQLIERAALPLELAWLNPVTQATYPKQTGAVPHTMGASISAALYGKAYPEFDRTLATLLLFKRLLAGDYLGFVTGQAESVRLTQASFMEVSKLVRRVAYNTNTRDALFSFLVFNNVGKSEAVINYLRKAANVSENNHQRVMAQLLKLYEFISPTFQRLDEGQRRMVLSSFEREFSLGQLAQGEAPARFLTEHAARTKEERDFYLATSLLKVAAARGHDTVVGSLVMTQPVYSGLKTAIDGIEGMANNESSVVQTHQEFLKRRAETIMPADGQLWTTRACLMFRCASPEDGRDLAHVIRALPATDAALLRREFSATGFARDSAVLLYYAPATLDNLRKTVSRADFFAKGVKLLATVLRAARLHVDHAGLQGVIQVRLDSIATQIRDENGLPANLDVEIYLDPNFGLSARFKSRACESLLVRAI
jgi:hypothetical protein